jgi:hypothetical protein
MVKKQQNFGFGGGKFYALLLDYNSVFGQLAAMPAGLP